MICRLNHLKFHWSNCFDRGIILHANVNHKLNGSQESGCQLNFSAHAHQHVSVSVILLPFFPSSLQNIRRMSAQHVCFGAFYSSGYVQKRVKWFFRRFFFHNSFWILILTVKLRKKKLTTITNWKHSVHDLKYVKIM